MARVVPTVMLFVKSLGGVSHTKDEDTPVEDLELSVRALDELTRRTLDWAAAGLGGAPWTSASRFQTDPPASRRRSSSAGGPRSSASRHAWTFDSHILWQEPYVIHSQMLSATERIMVGPFVTNPATRDPTVTASVFATLNDMFGNRTVCGIGRGDSARRVLGRQADDARPDRAGDPRHPRARRGARDRDPGRRGAASRGCATGASRSGWPPTARRRSRWSAACADGFVLQLADPVDPALDARPRARGRARRPGATPTTITVCVAAPAYVGDDLAHQRDQCRWFGGMVGNHVAEMVERYGDAAATSRTR